MHDAARVQAQQHGFLLSPQGSTRILAQSAPLLPSSKASMISDSGNWWVTTGIRSTSRRDMKVKGLGKVVGAPAGTDNRRPFKDSLSDLDGNPASGALPDEDDATLLADDIQGRRQRSIAARAFQHHRRAPPPRVIQHLFNQIPVRRIEDDVSPEVLGHLSAERLWLHDDDGRSRCLARKHGEQANRPGPKDDDPVVGSRAAARPPHAMVGNRHRLHQRGFLVAHIVRES